MTNELINKRGIKVSEREEIAAVLKKVNGKASRFTLGVLDVEALAKRSEEALEKRGLPQRLRVGVTVTYVIEGPAAAYKYSAKSTSLTVRRFAEGWRLMNAETIYISPRARSRFEVTVSKDVAEYIRKSATEGLQIAA